VYETERKKPRSLPRQGTGLFFGIGLHQSYYPKNTFP
jgi:hypothetical protein